MSFLVEYPYALDPDEGRLVAIENAKRGRQQGLICPDEECAAPMQAVQSPTGKVQWYFRHDSFSSCGYLHFTTLRLLEELLKEAISAHRNVQFQYTCAQCKRMHTQSLFTWDSGSVAGVTRERATIKGHAVKPDLTLQDDLSRPVALVEVVDTHKPEPPVIETGLPILEKNVSPPFLHELRKDGLKGILNIDGVHNISCPRAVPAPPPAVPGPEPESGESDSPPYSLPDLTHSPGIPTSRRLARPIPARDRPADLNPAQRDAVEAVDGPLLILAGPGSGKTRVITHRIAYMIRSLDVSPRSIAAVTFTNKAAREMRERLFGRSEHDPASPLLPGMWPFRHEFTVSTFHAMCAQILRRESLHAGLESTFVIYDQEDQLDAVKHALEILEIDSKRVSPRSVLSAISAAKSSLIDPEAFAAGRSTFADQIVSKVYRQYQDQLHRNNAVDFDDLLFRAYVLFRDNAQVLEKYRSRYEYLLIDEFQDTNVAQYAIARQLAGKHRNICVVGDPDQAIYSWRNADIRNILSFQRDYPDARTVTLGENYRSTSTILDAATGVISANNRRIDRPLTTSNGRGDPVLVGEAYTPEEEAQQVLGEIQRLKAQAGHSLGDCAVMYRVNAQSRALEDGCLRRAIPYRLIGGVRFYQRREVKDVIAYLRVVQNPYDDVSLLRIINVPVRGIGQRTVDQLVHEARMNDIPVYTAAQLMADSEEQERTGRDRGSRTGRAVARFLYVINALIESAGSLPVEELIDAIMERTGYRDHLRAEEGDQGQERLENIAELRATARELQPMEPSERLAAFLEGAALVSDVDALEEGEDAITLITLHQAKGLEFPVVFIVGLEEGMLPHIRSFDDPDQMEEERRLFYVGMTRAKERLYLTRSFRRDFRGSSGASRPSRFLSDVPQKLVSSLAMAGRRSAITPLGARTASRDSAAAELTGEAPLKAGERVRHARFGDGIVVSCVPSGTDHEVTVAFKGSSGIKRLLYSYAALEMAE